jgi:hypothetical protein
VERAAHWKKSGIWWTLNKDLWLLNQFMGVICPLINSFSIDERNQPLLESLQLRIINASHIGWYRSSMEKEFIKGQITPINWLRSHKPLLKVYHSSLFFQCMTWSKWIFDTLKKLLRFVGCFQVLHYCIHQW